MKKELEKVKGEDGRASGPHPERFGTVAGGSAPALGYFSSL